MIMHTLVSGCSQASTDPLDDLCDLCDLCTRAAAARQGHNYDTLSL